MEQKEENSSQFEGSSTFFSAKSNAQDLILSKEDLSLLFELPSELQRFKSLKQLRIEGATRLQSTAGHLAKLATLESLWVENLPELEQLCPLPEGLLSLTIYQCPKVALASDVPNTLRSLQVMSGDRTKIDIDGMFVIATLQHLQLKKMALKSLPLVMTLPALRSLDISNNRLTELPRAVSTLTTLETLDVSHNDLIELPPVIGALTSLASLNASHNSLARLPAEFQELQCLTDLDLSKNIFKEVPVPSTKCEALVHLRLTGNLIETVSPDVMGLTSLATLDLQGNPLYSHRADNYGRSLFQD